MIIYDASSLFERILKKDLDLDAFIADITIYEVGNIVLKHTRFLKNISDDEAKSILTIVANWKNLIYLEQDDVKAVYHIAAQTGLTYYDAAYVHLAKKYGATLETCDKKLHKAAEKHCKVKLLEISLFLEPKN